MYALWNTMWKMLITSMTYKLDIADCRECPVLNDID